MKLEHIACNVEGPFAMAAWYRKPCGLRIVRHRPAAAQAHFLSDSGSTIVGIYRNPPESVPDYRSMNPLQFHLALLSDDVFADAKGLD